MPRTPQYVKREPALQAEGKLPAVRSERVREGVLLAALGLLILALVFNIRWAWDSDDITFREFAAPEGAFSGALLPFLRMRMETWTSRILVEAAIFLVVNRLFWWRLGTALAFWLCAVIPPYLIARDRNTRLLLIPISALLLLAIPNVVWFDAGLVATSVNYLWVLAAALLAALPAIRFLQNRSFSSWWLVPAVCGALFAGSSEITAALLAVLFAVTLGCLIHRRQQQSAHSPVENDYQRQVRRVANWQLLFFALLSMYQLAWVVFHLVSPGNANRGQPSWFSPTFPIMLERAFSTTLRQMFTRGYIVILVFFVLLALKNYQRHGFTLFTWLSLVPVSGILWLNSNGYPGTMGRMVSNLFVDGNLLWDAREAPPMLTLSAPNLVALLLLYGAFACAIVAIIGAFKWGLTSQIILVMLGVGFASKFIVANTIGFALELPYHRTDMYLLYSFLAATLMLVADGLPRLQSRARA